MYKMFIDDERFPPDDGTQWVIVRSSLEAADFVEANGFPNFISWDHDLGGDDTSVVFLNWMINYFLDGNAPMDQFPTAYYIHSQNPIGAARIRGILDGFISCEVNHNK